MRDHVRVLIIAENACTTFGGEAVLPLRYFTLLRRRGVEAWLLTHARARRELKQVLKHEFDRIFFVEDSKFHRLLDRIGSRLEPRLRRMTTDFVLRLVTQREQRKLARVLIPQYGINVVHQPTPVSPREPSLIRALAAPVIIGPMNGETRYKGSFRSEDGLFTRAALKLAPVFASVLNHLLRGKLEASILLVANRRSRSALPKNTGAAVHYLPDNGVDTSVWKPADKRQSPSTDCKFVFVGRLVKAKGVDLLLEAWTRVADRFNSASLLIVGDGEERSNLEAQARSYDMLADGMCEPGKAYFAGWQSHERVAQLLADQDCLVLPTLIEAGGAVLLEAMAVGLPVIATECEGPSDYVDASCGVLIPLSTRTGVVEELARSMELLALRPKLRARMGAAGLAKVKRDYDWDTKIDGIMRHYRHAATFGQPAQTLNFGNHEVREHELWGHTSAVMDDR